MKNRKFVRFFYGKIQSKYGVNKNSRTNSVTFFVHGKIGILNTTLTVICTLIYSISRFVKLWKALIH